MEPMNCSCWQVLGLAAVADIDAGNLMDSCFPRNKKIPPKDDSAAVVAVDVVRNHYHNLHH
jgi:hypothetical protein